MLRRLRSSRVSREPSTDLLWHCGGLSSGLRPPVLGEWSHRQGQEQAEQTGDKNQLCHGSPSSSGFGNFISHPARLVWAQHLQLQTPPRPHPPHWDSYSVSVDLTECKIQNNLHCKWLCKGPLMGATRLKLQIWQTAENNDRLLVVSHVAIHLQINS